MSNRSKRLAIFHFCAPIVTKLLGCAEELYFCPICGNGYPEEAAFNGDLLTLEDVPPRNMGGKGLLLTCRECNSGTGRKVDFHIKSQTELNNLEAILLGQSNGQETSANLIFNGESFSINVRKTEKAIAIKLKDKSNDTKKINQLKDYMIALSASNSWDGNQFKITKSVKFNQRLLKVAFLKSGFLLLTAMLGYRYAFNKRLLIVREQILNPDDDILGTCFWIESGKDQAFIKRRIIFVSDPLPLFLVTYDRGAIILPSHSSPIDLYEIMKNRWKRGQSINFTGTVYKWPEMAFMVLDSQDSKKV